MDGAIYVSDSKNSKLHGKNPLDSTYVSIKNSCPKSCPLKDGQGCYAEISFVGLTVNRLDEESEGMDALEVAKAEASAIDCSYNGKEVPSGRCLRLHVSGDSRTIKGTKIINNAVGRWKKRGGGECFSYTHAWKHVSRDNWSNVSILASVNSLEEADQAREKGYAPAIIVSEFDNPKVFKMDNSDIKWIPCPAQTKPGGKEVGCSDCKLCMKADWLYESNHGIAFAAHGARKNAVKKHLKVIK